MSSGVAAAVPLRYPVGVLAAGVMHRTVSQFLFHDLRAETQAQAARVSGVWRYCIAARKYWSSRRIDIATHADLTELLLDSDYLAPGASGGHQGCPARTAWLTSLP